MSTRKKRAAAYRFALMCGAVAAVSPIAATKTWAQPTSDAVVDTIVVTARGREENVQDVPIQITAFSATDIVDAGVATTQDFIDLTPNVTLDDSFTYLNTFVTIRGIVTPNSNADSPIAVVVDGVPQNSQRQLKMNLFDVERIEVLRGPQGAFYGRNAVGGAINIVSKQPTNEFEGFGSAIYGNGDAVEVSAAVSGPIVPDRALFRIAGSYKQDDGRIENTFLNVNSDTIDHDYNIRGKLALFPTDWLTIDVRAMYNDFEAGTLYDAFVPSGDANDFQDPSTNLPGTAFGDIFEGTVKADADLGFATLTGIFGYTELREVVRGDIDFSNPINNPAGAFGAGQIGQGSDQDLRLISQEIRLASPDDQRLRWLVGGYYLHTDRTLGAELFADLNGTLEQINNPALVFLRQLQDDDNDAWSIYGQVDIDFTERLTVSAALRYDEDSRSQTDLLSSAVRDVSFDAIQPTVTVSYEVLPSARIYASYAEGFRSGGFNAPGAPQFRDETVRSVEGGFKSQWWDDRFLFNGAFYYSFVDDYQFFFLSLAAGGQIVSNIDEVEIYGVELEARAVLADGLEVFAGLGTTDTEIKANTPFPTSVGNKAPKTTDVTFNFGTQYRRPIADGLFAFARVDYEHRGERTWQIDNLDVQDALDLLNFRVGLETERWGLYAWGRNVTGEDYYTDYNPTEFTGLGFDIGFPAQPASFGAEARVRF